MTNFIPPTLGIIGGGASGTLLASQAAILAAAPLNIFVVEPAEHLGGGAAYGPATFTNASLNVPVQNMFGLIESVRPNDFQKYLERRGKESLAGTFALRPDFGLYLRDLSSRARKAARDGVTLEHIRASASDIDVANTSSGRILLDSGKTLDANAIVLALGNQAPVSLENLSLAQYFGHAEYIHDPWRGAQEYLGGGRKLVVGTGLTAVDIILNHLEQNTSEPIHAYSRSGKFPKPHDRELAAGRGPKYEPGGEFQSFLDSFEGPFRPRHASEVAAIIEREVKRASAQGNDWRQVIDRLRPVTQKLWQSFDESQKEFFLKNFRRDWDVHRHRMPPENWETIKKAIEDGRLKLHSGEFPAAIPFSHVINGTGLNPDYRHSSDPLLRHLFAKDFVRPGPLGLGLATVADGSLLGGAGALLHTLGTPRIGDLWESIAIPDIRKQVHDLAKTLLLTLNIPVREGVTL